MTIQQIKQLVLFAEAKNIKYLNYEGLNFEFFDRVKAPTHEEPRPLVSAAPIAPERIIPPPDPGPTLDQINEYIYKDPESA